MQRLLLTAAATATLVSTVATAWNIGGHSPVKDLSTEQIQNAVNYVVANGKEELSLPNKEEYSVGAPNDCKSCESCACLLSATKQIVAGMNWDLVIKFVPKGQQDGVAQYRKVTVFDQSFAGTGDDQYTIKKSDTMEEAAALASSSSEFTQSALDSISNPEAQSDHHHLADNQGEEAAVASVGSDPAKAYMDKLGSRTSGLVQHVTFTPDGCATAQKVKQGDVVSMHYTGTLPNGKKFDSSYDRGTPFDFKEGANQVIKGWEQAVPGMCIGEKSRLYIPSNLGYGDRGFGDVIPPKSNLIFDVEVMNIKSA